MKTLYYSLYTMPLDTEFSITIKLYKVHCVLEEVSDRLIPLSFRKTVRSTFTILALNCMTRK
jgi:hypothetical protein